MKTLLLTSVKRLKNYSKIIDAEAILYDKSWAVFNETGDKELTIFRPNKELLISRKGIIQKGKWELLDIANIIIDMGERTYLFNASYVEDEFQTIEGYLEERYNELDNDDFIAAPSIATPKEQEYNLTDDILGILKLIGIGCVIAVLACMFTR